MTTSTLARPSINEGELAAIVAAAVSSALADYAMKQPAQAAELLDDSPTRPAVTSEQSALVGRIIVNSLYLSLGELRRKAYDSMRGETLLAANDSRLAVVIDHKVVNYLRHRWTNFDQLLRESADRSPELAHELKAEIHEVIARRYPALRAVCEWQTQRSLERVEDWNQQDFTSTKGGN